jgi:hypothetical protein
MGQICGKERLFPTGRSWLSRVMPTEQLQRDGLHVRSSRDVLVVRMSPMAAVEFQRRGDHGSVCLRFGRAGIGPDVSVQPGAVGVVIDDHARLAGDDPNRWRTGVLRALLDWQPTLPSGLEADRLTATVGAFTHPLLAAVYEQGAPALAEVPRWASQFLRAADLPTAARQLTGGDASRRLTRSPGRQPGRYGSDRSGAARARGRCCGVRVGRRSGQHRRSGHRRGPVGRPGERGTDPVDQDGTGVVPATPPDIAADGRCSTP